MPRILEKPLHPDLIFNARSFDAESLWATKAVSGDDLKSSKSDLDELLASKDVPAVHWQVVVMDKPDQPPTCVASAIIKGLDVIRGPKAGTLRESASRLAYLLLLDDEFMEWVNAGPEMHNAQPRTYLIAEDGLPLLI